jgi:hypothetical protein
MFGDRACRAAFIVLTLISAACSKSVTIPPPNQDSPPTVTLNAFVVQQPSGYSGDVDRANVSDSTSVGVTTGAQIQISGSARNAGGVKSFTISIRQANRVVFQATATAAPDATGMVPDLLSILGTDGTGGPGNMPMVVTMREPVQVVSTALNFNGMAKSITVNYLPVSIVVVGGGGPPPGGTDTTARLLLAVDHVLGPFQSSSGPADLCRAHLTWSAMPQSLTGSTGSGTPFTQQGDYTPTPTWRQSTPGNLWSADCAYGTMLTNLRTGTWTINVSGNTSPSSDPSTVWQTHCQVALKTGTNTVRFNWGAPSSPTCGP